MACASQHAAFSIRHDSDASMPSYDHGQLMKRCMGPAERRPWSRMRTAIRYMWVTEVLSGKGFFAVTEKDQEKAAKVKAALAAQLGDSPTMAERVVPRMICALKVNGSWERVMVKSHCTSSCCSLRTEGKEQTSDSEHWHVCLLEVGSMKCVALSQLALVTRDIASETRKARLYFLRRIYIDDEKKDQAKAFLKSQIMNNQRLMAEVFYPSPEKGQWNAYVEIVFGNIFLSDVLVDAGFAKYSRFRAHDQKRNVSEEASGISQEIVTVGSRSLVHDVPPHAPQVTESHVRSSTLPELMELIGHLMKKRKESAYLTSRHSALNTAIKLPFTERAPQHQGQCEHGHASLDMYQKLLRKLLKESPYVEEVMDMTESLYEELPRMFGKWKASNKKAQKKSDVAIDIMANIFLNFRNYDFGLENYRHDCKNLETSLRNELLLKNEGQGLAQLIVPAVAKKLMAAIEKLKTSASGQTLHQFITSSRNINSLAVETLAKDILKGLYHYHVRGVAYKHLHPENVLVINGHARLRLKTLDDLQECMIGEDWPFESVKVAKEDLSKPGDVFKFGLLVLWMACMGVDSYNTATMKFLCNMTLLKMIMAQNPNQRPLVESMVCMDSPIFYSSSQGCSMPLSYYLKKLFNDKCAAELEEESSDQPSDMEMCSESESMFQPTTEEESGNETTESKAPKSNPPSLLSTEGEAKKTPPPSTPMEEA